MTFPGAGANAALAPSRPGRCYRVSGHTFSAERAAPLLPRWQIATLAG